MMHEMLNIARREAERVMAQRSGVRIGVVTGYDPENYCAKVEIQPERVETGWLPISTPWSGNGWGEYCPPTPGDVVDVHFQEGGKEAGFIGNRHYGDRFRPLAVPSGERWTVHQSGSCLKFHNDGSVEISSPTRIASTAPRWDHTGEFNATSFYAQGVSAIADGTYRTGLGLSQDGYITTKGGMIVAIIEAQ
ncbi:phage baseplate assembly protein V [Tundrisphaera sp. TA3]|uniref:phage baseplate assembly protein V n=1 Tax=Tundrisphaera sp. TA3 TaxID=3435775 RepID=UPI003EBCA59E